MTFDLSSYQTVEERLREFWSLHPYGRVNTELLYHEGGDYIVKAIIWRGDEVGSNPPAATGLAHDSEATLVPTMKASALEVCETSAIGRALANLGLAPKGARPSLEEMQKARAAVVSPPKPSDPAPSSNPLGDLLEAVGGSEMRAINAVNKAMHTAYSKSELEGLEPEDWQAGLALVKAK